MGSTDDRHGQEKEEGIMNQIHRHNYWEVTRD